MPSDKVDTNSTTPTSSTTPTTGEATVGNADNDSAKQNKYTSLWGDTLNDTMQKLLNGEKFSYDFNEDALYQQYKDKYIKQGKLAMADTIGQASAMTGGYGNSYAQSVGQQAYQASLENLNDIVPELYQMAYDRYNSDKQDLYNQYAMLSAQEEQNYSKWIDERNYNYGVERDTIADQQWQAEFDEAKRQYDEQMAFTKQQYEDSKVSNIVNNSGGGNIIVDENGNYQVVEDPYNIDNVSAKVIEGVKKLTTEDGQAAYLAKLQNDGVITPEQKMTLLDQYGATDLKNRSWEVVKDGGRNWFGIGINANAEVRDEFGNEYSLAELRKELMKTMTREEANKEIKKIEKKLGIKQ